MCISVSWALSALSSEGNAGFKNHKTREKCNPALCPRQAGWFQVHRVRVSCARALCGFRAQMSLGPGHTRICKAHGPGCLLGGPFVGSCDTHCGVHSGAAEPHRREGVCGAPAKGKRENAGRGVSMPGPNSPDLRRRPRKRGGLPASPLRTRPDQEGNNRLDGPLAEPLWEGLGKA